MSARRYKFHGISLEIPSGWQDVTASMGLDSPPTLGRSDGVGALQFSIAKYRSGVVPHFSVLKLRELIADFAEKKSLDRIGDIIEGNDGVVWVRGDFSTESEAIRVWYISDGRNICLLTYLSSTLDDPAATMEADQGHEIALSIRFDV